MPLPGGDADKAGNRYEVRWTVKGMLDVLTGRAQSIYIEPFGDEGKGIEFFMTTESGRECYQIKRQRSKGPWTLSALELEEVLSAFLVHLKQGSRCVFASMNQAEELRELGERARNSSSWIEFERHQLEADAWRKNFERLCAAWNLTPGVEPYEMLRRVEVRTQDELSLQEHLLDRLVPLVSVRPEEAYRVLAELALDSMHRELYANGIWDKLKSEKIHPRDLHKNTQLAKTLTDNSYLFISRIEKLGITGKTIPREQTARIIESFSRKQRVVLTGNAGSGKSSILSQVVSDLRVKGWPVFIIRADQELHASTPETLGSTLGLPGSPAAILSGVAANGDSLLVIDQLDAVSQASGRNPERFELLMATFTQAQTFPRVRVLLACRQFDVDNDDRFRALVAGDETVVLQVGEFSRPTLDKILENKGIETSKLSKGLVELLLLPLHLRLYVELLTSGMTGLTEVRSLKDLYDRYWDFKQRAVRLRLKRANAWTEIIETLCSDMTRRQELSVPVALLDNFSEERDVLMSEGVLALDDRRIRFFHETFFDYAYARTFTVSGGSLLELLEKGRQELFLRAQVRQILQHQREADLSGYLENIYLLTSRTDIRLHIKVIVLSLIGSFSDPTFDEWSVVAPFIEHSPDGACASPFWRAFRTSRAWFQIADDSDCWTKWLLSGEDLLADAAAWTLVGAHAHSPERVAWLVNHCLHHHPNWKENFHWFVQHGEVTSNAELFEILIEQISKGAYDEFGFRDIRGLGSVTEALTKSRPNWAARLVGVWVLRQAIVSSSLSGHEPPQGDGSWGDRWRIEELLKRLAAKAPEEFIKEVLPGFLKMLLWAHREEEGDPSLSVRKWLESTLEIREIALNCLGDSLEALSKQSPKSCRLWINELLIHPSKEVRRLIAKAYCGNAFSFADEAIDWVCKTPNGFEIGQPGGADGGSRALIAAVTLHCSEVALERISSVLLSYTPPWERSAEARELRGYSQFKLLSSFNPERRSQSITRRIGELERKLGPLPKDEPVPQARLVKSPIPQERANEFSDAQWLQAMTGINRGDVYKSIRGEIFGGSRELNRELERCTARQPVRFAQLLLQLPADCINTYAFGILAGLQKSTLDASILLSIGRRVRSYCGNQTGRWLVDLVSNHSNLDLPAELIDIVVSYANDVDDDGCEAQGNDVDSIAINCTRGRAVITLGKLLAAAPSKRPNLKDVLAPLAKSSVHAVRAAVLECCLRVWRHDPELALDLFRKATEDNEIILSSRHVESLIHTSHWKHYESLASVIDRMTKSSTPKTAMAGARQLALASLIREELDVQVDCLLHGTVEQRMGVAEVATANVLKGPRVERLQTLLAKLLDDENVGVREIALRSL